MYVQTGEQSAGGGLLIFFFALVPGADSGLLSLARVPQSRDRVVHQRPEFIPHPGSLRLRRNESAVLYDILRKKENYMWRLSVGPGRGQRKKVPRGQEAVKAPGGLRDVDGLLEGF